MRLRVIDSHTEGEPTRVVLDGQIALTGTTMEARRAELGERYDSLRRGIVLEPRGSDVVVGALLTQPVRPDSVAGVIFFNNEGLLNMCGHGTIGVAETLAHLGHIGPGRYQLDTPVGPVGFERHADGSVSVTNVLSRRHAKDVIVSTRFGDVTGDVAWGGNWFFIVHHEAPAIEPRNLSQLAEMSIAIRKGLEAAGVTGEGGAVIDHVELNGPSNTPGVDARNYVLCPGLAIDRSPCGTGTSAKMACLAEDGLLQPGQTWTQESVMGGIFRGTVQREGDAWRPTIQGRAFITAESTLIFREDDPYRSGLVTS